MGGRSYGGCPDRYLGTHFHQRRKRRRPSAKASELGDAGVARSRARVSLQEQYKAPQVYSFLFWLQWIAVMCLLDRLR